LKISLCLVVLDEIEGCRVDVPGLPRDAFEEVYAVDGGSTDGTVEYLQAQGIRVHRQPSRGLNAAYLHANQVSTGDAVVVFFPKGTTPPGDLRRFRPLLEGGHDLVVASRSIRHARHEEDVGWWRPRKWAVRCLALLAGLMWRREGYWVRDVLHGVKGFRREAFARMRILDHGLSIDIEMVARSYKLRLARCEFPTSERARSAGDTHFKMWPTGKKLLAYLWFELRRTG
jgi:glycosyltransferase involved in cell wall biosynthesis